MLLNDWRVQTRGWLFIAAFGTLFGTLFACGPASSGQGSATYRVATSTTPGQFHGLAEAFGVLAGQHNGDGTACFWISRGSGREALMWPLGSTAGGSPLAVYDGTGHLMAAVGQRVNLTGSALTTQDLGSSLLGCPGDVHLFAVAEVSKT